MSDSKGNDSARARLQRVLQHPVSRRRFLQFLGAASAAACGKNSSSSPADAGPDAIDAGVDATDAGLDVMDAMDAGDVIDAMDATDAMDAADACCDGENWFDIMEQLRSAFRQSPDHLRERARELVEEADAERIFEFVRDRVRLVPYAEDSLTSFDGNWMHWGPRAALRSGRGTHRTKAELLANLYRDAGFEASVFSGIVTLTEEALRVALLGVPAQSSPAITENELIDLIERIDGDPSGELSFVPPTQQEADSLAQLILDTLPAGTEGMGSWLGSGFEGVLALVRVTVAGETFWANPNHPLAVFGESMTTNEPRLVDDEPATHEVEVRLEWIRARTPDQFEVLVENTWDATEVAGRRLNAILQPFGDYEQFVASDVRTQRVYLPLLVFPRDEGQDAPESVRGEVVTVEGRTIVIDEDAETVQIDGVRLLTDAGSDAAAAVVSLEARADATAYPDIRVRFAAYDADGVPVAGLTAANLSVLDEEERVSCLVTSNSPSRPRVLFVVDKSGSVAEAFQGENLSPRLRAIMEGVASANPDAEFAMQTINFGIDPDPEWTTDQDAVVRSFEDSFADGSEIWSASATAQQTGASVAILVTDGNASDEPSDALRARLGGGVPVVCIHATADGAFGEVVEEIATLTGGAVVPIDEPEEVVTLVLAELAIGLEVFYELTFQSPLGATGERTVTLATSTGVETEVTYIIPAESERATPNVPIGLYYVVRLGDREVRRTIAGWTPIGFEVPAAEDLAEFARDVRENAMSGVTLHFEAGPPNIAELFDDELTSRLSLQGFAPLLKGEISLLEAEPAHMELIPGPVPAAVDVIATVPDEVDGTPVFPLSLSVVASGTHTRFLDDERARGTAWVDLLPLTRFGAYGPSAEDSFRAAARATALQALWEANAYDVSTVSVLDGRDLTALTTFGYLDDLDVEVSAEDRAVFDRMLRDVESGFIVVDSAGAPVGAWIVDTSTGAIIGRLPSARGGSEFAQDLDFLNKLVGYAGWLGGLSGALGPGQAGLIALVIFHIKMWTLAEACLVSLQPVSTADVDAKFATLLCDIARAFAAAPYGGADALFGLVEMVVGKSLCERVFDTSPPTN